MKLRECQTLFLLAVVVFAVGEARMLRKRSDNHTHSDSDEDHSDGGITGTMNELIGGTEGFITNMMETIMDLTMNTVGGTVNLTQGAVGGVLHFVEMIPIVGPLTEGTVHEMEKAYKGFEKMTNGLIARVLGGAMPCTVSLKYGLQCEGVRKKGGISQVIINAMQEVPLMPDIAIQLAKAIMSTVFDPMTDVVAGGVPRLM